MNRLRSSSWWYSAVLRPFPSESSQLSTYPFVRAWYVMELSSNTTEKKMNPLDQATSLLSIYSIFMGFHYDMADATIIGPRLGDGNLHTTPFTTW